MKEQMNNKLYYVALAAPVVLFVMLYLMTGMPEQSVFTRTVFYVQTAVSVLVIVSIPALLWFVRRERYAENEKLYRKMTVCRIVWFTLLSMACVLLYYIVPNVTFFYLAVMVYLSMFFARK